MSGRLLKQIIFDICKDLIQFPFWWYGEGTIRAYRFCKKMLFQAEQSLAAGLWLKNIFVPMYGRHDLQGKIMSISIRLANVLVRGSGLLIVFFCIIVLFILWLIWPLFILFRLLGSLIS